MEISGSMNIVAQEIATNKTQTGFDVLTKTVQKAGQNEQNEDLRMAVAQQTGKGLNIDVKA